MNPILIRLLPLLFIYIAVVLLFSTSELTDDENRYFAYATNLTKGYYADRENPELENGPIYPMILMPFVYFDAPIISMQLLNPLLLFAGVLYYYKLLRIYLDKKPALIFTYLVALYPLTLLVLLQLHSECLTFFLVSGAYFHFCKTFQENSRIWLQFVLASIYFALLILTKVLFAYVIVVGCTLLLTFFLFNRSAKSLRGALLCIITLVLCTPYLVYTHSLTGKVFLWGTGGGGILYWKTSPFPEEFGNWNKLDILSSSINSRYQNSESIQYHIATNKAIEPLPYVKRDEWLKKRAIENMKSHPDRYIINTIASFGRLLFSYPYSYTEQKFSTYFYLLPNMFLFVISVFCFIAGLLRYQRIPWEIRALFGLFVIYIGGICLLNGIPRHFLPVYSILVLLNGFVITRIVSIRLRNE